MKLAKSFKKTVIWVLVVLLAVPAPALAQGTPAETKKFSQQQLDQMLAPIALYPDALLAQVLMAATYPLEVVTADRWVKQNQGLKGEQLNDAVDKQPWDASVKALVPVPDVLSMMSEKLDWTQTLGDAFLAQEGDVMATVQQLRQKAYGAGNLKDTEQQKVIVEQEAIRVEPADPEIIYVPVYDPWWVYGPWWWPAFPPFIIFPHRVGVVIVPGTIFFGFGFFVGVHWGTAWGRWDWRSRQVFVNANRTINFNRSNINVSNMRTTTWVHDPVHRRGVIYRDQLSRERFGNINRGAVENRRVFRGFETTPGGAPGAVTRPGGSSAAPGVAPARPGGGPGRSGLVQGGSPNAFTGIGRGSEVRSQSSRGSSAISGSPAAGTMMRGAGGAGRGSFSGGSGRGGFSGGSGRGGGGGSRGRGR